MSKAQANTGSGEHWFRDKLQHDKDEANKQVGRFQGQIEAYNEVTAYLDPEKYCQVCGYQYSTWNNAPEDKVKHDATHATAPPQVAK